MNTFDFNMARDAVYMVPLGGCGIFGANMTLYGHRDQWVMVDCGMGFADETMPGIDILLPDPSFAVSLGDKLLGIVLTHGHEDHIGALEHLWPRLKAPLYATKFTATRIRQAFSETPWGGQTKLHDVPLSGRVALGPFDIEYVNMAHSIPEACALAITVNDVGTIVHTGDWKLDEDPVVGQKTDEKRLKEIGEAGVLALVGDSTNAMVPGHSGSERMVQKNLSEVFGEFRDACIAVSCFSTNVARLKSISEAAQANDRQICLVGRSLWNSNEAARHCDYLSGVPEFLTDDEANLLPAEKLVYVCTGSQGEPRAALSRIARDDHKALQLAEGDVVIFSSRTIPGNERAIDRIKNRFMAAGVNVVTDRDAPIHVSGHPYRDELKALYSWVKPLTAIPVHGEHMQQEKHAALAEDCGVGQVLIPQNGHVIEVSKEGAQLMGHVDSGILAIEGKRIVAVDHEAILMRRRLMHNGSVVVTVVVDGQGNLVAPPKVTAMGLLDESSEVDAEYIEGVVEEISKKIENTPKGLRRDDDELGEQIRITARRYFSKKFDRKPQTRVHLVRI
ncbi:MAG: MBL fold metallo-hydrolase [Alphaproteobacteria bacterium]|nr:MBL fold metallo-hydrolase [Alphaproteobacteria bacterium]